MKKNRVTQADEIRRFCIERYVEPGRRACRGTLTVRAGDVARDMCLRNGIPNICSVLGGRKFLAQTGFRLLERTGPRAGVATEFRYGVTGRAKKGGPRTPALPLRSRAGREVSRRVGTCPSRGRNDTEATLYLVSCVGKKRLTRAPARCLYTSGWFQKARTYVETTGRPWFILSAKHGLLDPETVIRPYNKTLNDARRAKRRLWAWKVLDRLKAHLDGVDSVVVLAGKRYREVLEPELLARGIDVCVPMRGLRIGEQLSWLKKRLSSSGRLADTVRFYDILRCLEKRIGGPCALTCYDGWMNWPKRGVYFFFEDDERRSGSGKGLRVTRVGTHAPNLGAKTMAGLETCVSECVGSMRFLWLNVDDPPGPESLRGFIERNAIALLSGYRNPKVDPPSQEWLGRLSDWPLVRASGLWNNRHVDEPYDPSFLDEMEKCVDETEPL